MKTLRESKVLAVLGMLAVAVMVVLVAAPAAEAGGYGHAHYSSFYTPVASHYVAPLYPSCNYYPTYYPTYYTPAYYGHGCHYPW